MRNIEITEPGPLLRPDGSLVSPGWSRSPIKNYSRFAVKASPLRIKEWDYYLVLSRDFGVAFTISDDGYVGLQSVSLLRFDRPSEHTETVLDAFPLGRHHLPESSLAGITNYQSKRLGMTFSSDGSTRSISCRFSNFFEGKTLSANIVLREPPAETMVIATPWQGSKRAFYYNQKINCMRAEGYVRLGDEELRFDPDADFGTLDWGRGVWTYDNRWYWGSGNGMVGGEPFGFNLGYGFGDTGAATENVIFRGGRIHKLDDVVFNIPVDQNGNKLYIKPWSFTSSDSRFETEFVPILDRCAKIDLGVIVTDQHQVFGRMSGRAVLDDGEVIEFRDLLSFAEDVHNKY